MAKWGEGDPRWIVEERPDATNVNNWHWTEKNADDWSKEKLKCLFEGLVIKQDKLGTVKLISITKCDGEATANNRKAKLIFFYEWAIEISWEAELLTDPQKEISGSLNFHLTEEYTPDEIDIDVSVEKGEDDGDKFKDFLRHAGLKDIQSKADEYIKALSEEYSKGIILPTLQQNVTTNTVISNVTSKSFKEALALNDKTPKNVVTEYCNLTISEEFKCTAQELFNVLTTPELVTAFTRSKAVVFAEKGGKFSLFGGNINGTFELLRPPHEIKQKWRKKEWQSGHYSDVTITVVQNDGVTNLKLVQKGVPSGEVDKVKEGWRLYYWDAIRRIFGFGAFLM